jgi:hypothetical protein
VTRAIPLFSAGAIGIFAGSLAAQARPDLSGRWTTEPERTAEAGRGQGQAGAGPGAARGRGRTGDLGSGWGPTITITQDANHLTVEYMFFERRDMQPPLSLLYALDGSETRASLMMGRGIQVQASTAAWVGDRLVITTRHSFTNPETGQPMTSGLRRTLSLETPDSLVVLTLRDGVLGGPSSTTRTVYRRL